jgi:hypothetical protein
MKGHDPAPTVLLRISRRYATAICFMDAMHCTKLLRFRADAYIYAQAHRKNNTAVSVWKPRCSGLRLSWPVPIKRDESMQLVSEPPPPPVSCYGTDHSQLSRPLSFCKWVGLLPCSVKWDSQRLNVFHISKNWWYFLKRLSHFYAFRHYFMFLLLVFYEFLKPNESCI